MKLVFAGTPAFAATALDAIVGAGHEVSLVLTQPDRPAGRGMQLQYSAVKQVALRHGLPIFQPATLKDAASHQRIVAADAEVMVVAAYGLLLPQAVLDIPARGCVNIHASLLPRWRGAAPIQRAIEAGDDETGITIMRMEAGLDTGPMLLQSASPITATDDSASVHDKLAILGANLIVKTLQDLAALHPTPQPLDGVTYANKINKQEAVLDWRRPAIELERRIRAFSPFPGAIGELNGVSIKLWQATLAPGGGVPGTVLDVTAGGIVVATGEGALCLLELQRPGSRRLLAADFLRGFAVRHGDRFVLPDN